jgi:hypothetical protein
MPRQLFIVFPLLFLIVAIVYDANANENTATGAETQTEAEKLENEYDEDDLGGADYAVEEIIFGSPQDIEDMTNQALKEFAYKIRKEEGLKGPGGYGTICSKDEHCEEHEKCTKNGRCRPKNSTIPDSCRYGLSTCVHAEDSPMRKLADKVIEKRASIKPKALGDAMHAALLPPPAQNLLSLAPPEQLRPEGYTDKDLQASPVTDQNELSRSMAAYVDSVALVDDIAKGALTGAGALPQDTKQWLAYAAVGKKRVMRRPFRNFWDPQDRTYRIAQDQAEKRAMVNASKILEKRQFPNADDHELMEWFLKYGGKLIYAKPGGTPKGTRKLVAEEDIMADDLVLEVPLKITMNQLTVRNIKAGHTGRYLGEYIGGLFSKNQEWGLAAMLLYELDKGNHSKWWPMIKTFDMHMLTAKTIKELEGTYTQNRIRELEDDAENMHKFFEKVVGQKDHMGEVTEKWSTRKKLRWALWVARRHSVYVTKVTTGARIKAFVPFANYLTHKRGSGGTSIVTLNNYIKIGVGEHGAGNELFFDHGPYSDSDTMIRYHKVDERERNPYDKMIVGLPGARGSDGDDIFWEWTNMKEWRRAMKLPPKQSDLWRLADKLHLYGEEWDEEEQKKIAGMNINVKGLPLPLEQASVEEQLMLLGYAKTEEEAQLIAYGTKVKKKDQDKKPQLYSALDPEEDERAKKAVEEMSDAMVQLQEAVAAAHTDPSVLKVINQTRDFFLYGIQPERGLDAVDKLMTRKRTLIENCGNMTGHYIYYGGVSTELLCALRIHIMNETETNEMCPMQDGAFWAEEKKCDGGVGDFEGFNWTLPISVFNENKTIDALQNTVRTLQERYKTTIEEDENLLQLSLMSDIQRSVITVRKREKELLQSVMEYLDDRRDNLESLPHQIEALQEAERERKRKEKEHEEWKLRVAEEEKKPKVVVSFPIDLGKGNKPNFTVNEGEELEQVATLFAQTHGLTDAGLKSVIKSAKKRVAKQPTLMFFTKIVLSEGLAAGIRVFEGENITEVVERFCALHGLTKTQTNMTVHSVRKKYEKRVNRTVLLSFPVTVPDGRSIQIDIRQGEQHDLVTHFQDLGLCMKLNIDTMQIANVAFQRLKNVLVQIPIALPQRRPLSLNVRQGDDPKELVESFCELYGIPEENVPAILTPVLRGLYPEAIVVPFDPNKNYTTADVNAALGAASK